MRIKTVEAKDADHEVGIGLTVGPPLSEVEGKVMLATNVSTTDGARQVQFIVTDKEDAVLRPIMDKYRALSLDQLSFKKPSTSPRKRKRR